jgi:hypothetical protein
MKKILIRLLALVSISSFAQSNVVVDGIHLDGETYTQETCDNRLTKEILHNTSIGEMGHSLRMDKTSKSIEIFRKARELAQLACESLNHY